MVLLWLSAYGAPESEKMDFLVWLRRFRSTAFLQRVFGAEFNVRNTMAKSLTFRSRNATKSQQDTGSGASYLLMICNNSLHNKKETGAFF
jgi:hypothetical protein